MSYWDSSALVKLYMQELDSAEFRELAVKQAAWRPCRARKDRDTPDKSGIDKHNDRTEVRTVG
jgi:hypothetical protein